MRKIASPNELTQELRNLLAYAGSPNPSREKLDQPIKSSVPEAFHRGNGPGHNFQGCTPSWTLSEKDGMPRFRRCLWTAVKKTPN